MKDERITNEREPSLGMSYDDDRRLSSLLGEWVAPSVSPDFDQRLYQRIALVRERSVWQRVTDSFGWRPALSLASATATLALLFFLLLPPKDTKIDPARPSRDADRVESIEIDQVEHALDDLEMLRQLSASSSQAL